MQAIVSDTTAGTQGGELAPSKRRFASTIYGRKIGILIIDEAHLYRNANKQFKALLPLRRITDFILLLTATPVVTRPQVSLTPHFV